MQYSEAVVGFFDVSGFSALARDLEQADRARSEKALKKRSASSYISQHSITGKGAEELVRQLNETLSVLIETIRAAGGDIIKFAGDAILVVWLCDEDPLECQLIRAADCATACTALKSEESKLGLHVGIGCGELVAAHVGGIFGRWEFFIAGEACTQSALAEHHAGMNQVVLSPQAKEIIQGSKFLKKIEGDNLEEGFLLLKRVEYSNFGAPPRSKYILSSNATAAKAAEGYVPGPVRDALKNGGSSTASVGGLRKLTVIFFKLYDVNLPEKFDESSEKKFLEQCQNQAQLVQDSAYHYWATLRQFILDDKGFVAIVVLGLPPFFHEDNAVRAIKVAKRLIEHHKVRATAGICTGTVFCGVVGSSMRAEYSVAGSCINLAARLMAKATPGSIWCDTTTKMEAESIGHIRFEQFPSLTFKGFDHPVEIYGPIMSISTTPNKDIPNEATRSKVSAISTPKIDREDSGLVKKRKSIRAPMGRSIALVGMENETVQLAKASFLGPHSVRICFIEGEAGSGKSRLVEWVLKETGARRCILSTADSSETNTPFFVWRAILQNILALTRTTTSSGSFLTNKTISESKGDSSKPVSRKRVYSNEAVTGRKELSGGEKPPLPPSNITSLPSGPITALPPSTFPKVHKRTQSNSSLERSNSSTLRPSRGDSVFADVVLANMEADDAGSSSDDEATRTNPLEEPQLIARPPSRNTRFSVDFSQNSPMNSRLLSFGTSTIQPGTPYLPDHSQVLESLHDQGKLKGKRLSYLHLILPNLVIPSDLEVNCFTSQTPPLPTSGSSVSILGGILGTPQTRRASLTGKSMNIQTSSTNSVLIGNSQNLQSQSQLGSNDREPQAETMDLMLLLIEECGLLASTEIIIENAQFMDKQSWELLKRCVEFNPKSWKNENRVRFVVTYRPFQFLKDHPLYTLLHPFPIYSIASNPSFGQSQVTNAIPTSPTSVQNSPAISFNEKVSQPPSFERVSSTISAALHYRRRSLETREFSRPDSEFQSSTFVESDPVTIRIVIHPFSQRESGIFLSNYYRVAIGPKLLSFIFKKSKGNPRALLDCFKALQDQDLITVDPSTGTVEETTSLEDIGDMVFIIPLHLRAQLQQQFDKLMNREQLILKLASVIGSTIPISLLRWLYKERVVQLTSPHIDSRDSNLDVSQDFEMGLKELKTKNFLRPYLHSSDVRPETSDDIDTFVEAKIYSSSPNNDEDWVFESDFVRFLVYSQMLHTARKEIHGLILDWYLSRPALLRIREDPSILGNHAVGAERPTVAFKCFREGLRRVIFKQEPIAKGTRLWQSCVDLLDDSQTGFPTNDFVLAHRISIDVLMGQVCLQNESWDEALLYLTRAMEHGQSYPQKALAQNVGCFTLFIQKMRKNKSRDFMEADPLTIEDISPSSEVQSKLELAQNLVKRIQKCQETRAKQISSMKSFSLKEVY